MVKLINNDSKKEQNSITQEMLGAIHPPVLRYQLTYEKILYLANAVASGAMTPMQAIQQENRYRKAPLPDAVDDVDQELKPLPLLSKL
jgi:hypothetical protein